MNRIILKRLLLLAAMAVMVLAVAMPALAGGTKTNNSQNAEEVSQDSELEAESGEVDQTFEVTGSGANSNQCAGVQGVNNTGNQQGVIDLIQFESEADDFAFDEVGGALTVDGTNETTCDQQVDQAASAFGR